MGKHNSKWVQQHEEERNDLARKETLELIERRVEDVSRVQVILRDRLDLVNANQVDISFVIPGGLSPEQNRELLELLKRRTESMMLLLKEDFKVFQ